MIILKIVGVIFLISFIQVIYQDIKKIREEEKKQEYEFRLRQSYLKMERELRDDMRNLLNSGHKMEAIRQCRDFSGCSLSKAKTIVSELEWDMEYEKQYGKDYRPYAHGRAHWELPEDMPDTGTEQEEAISADPPPQTGDLPDDCTMADESFAAVKNQRDMQSGQANDATDNQTASARKLRKDMKALMIFSLLTSGLIGIGASRPAMTIGAGSFFAILAWIFFMLAKSPEGDPFMFIANRLVKKSKFILISLIAAFAFSVVLMIVSGLPSNL